MGVMGCFTFSDGNKRRRPNSVQMVSNLPSSSALGDDDVNGSGSDFNSQDISDTSTESMRKNSFFSMSQRSTSNLRVFTFQELKVASKGFSRSVRIGEGGFGCVYRGVIKSLEDPSTKIDVAIKQLGKRGIQGHKEWVTEVNFLGVVENPNLVKLLGYCADDDERGIQRLLIYEYMPNGSVEDHLSPRSRTILPWAMRLRIARDAARGLAYLHEEMDFQIIFRDFKPSNILLDEQWNAKLSDFGLARLGPPEGLTHVSTAIVGTMGYAAPEYMRTGRLTSKNDVWSYGIFLYVLITGRKPIDTNRPKYEQRLIEWVRPFLSDIKKFEHIVDPRLRKNYPLKSIHKLSAIANRCLVRQPKSRPKMSDVLEMINNIIGTSAEFQVPLQVTYITGEETSEVKNAKRKAASRKSAENNWLDRLWRPTLWKSR